MGNHEGGQVYISQASSQEEGEEPYKIKQQPHQATSGEDSR